MMAANIGQAAAVTTVPVAAAAGVLSVGVLLAAASAAGACTVLFQAGYNPYLRALVDPEDYLRANAGARAAHSTANLTGPALAGVLVQAVGSATTVLADAASFLVSFVSLAALPASRNPPAPAPGGGGSLAAQIREGLAALWHDPLLRTLAWATASLNLLLTAIGAIEVVFLVRAVHASPTWVGLLFAVGATGGIAGSVAAPRLSRRFGLDRVARSAVALTAPAALLMPLTTHGLGMAYFAVAGPLTGFGLDLASVSFGTLRLHRCPPPLQARTSTTSRTMSAVAITVGALLGGALGQAVGTRLALLVFAAGYLAAGLGLLAAPGLRPHAARPSGHGALGPVVEKRSP